MDYKKRLYKVSFELKFHAIVSKSAASVIYFAEIQSSLATVIKVNIGTFKSIVITVAEYQAPTSIWIGLSNPTA